MTLVEQGPREVKSDEAACASNQYFCHVFTLDQG
jgi:hypothetical protein